MNTMSVGEIERPEVSEHALALQNLESATGKVNEPRRVISNNVAF